MPIQTITGSFDDLRSWHIRFLEDKAKSASLHVQVWSDELFRSKEGKSPKFPAAERLYFVDAIRYVTSVEIVDRADDSSAIPVELSDAKFTDANLPDANLRVFPESGPIDLSSTGKKKVIVTGCYDWLHTGHVRFFEEVAAYGDVYAIVGHDANIELLKGKGHPQFHEAERRYVVNALKYVKQGLISTGHGWMDAAPEIATIKPDIYAVNEDGDKPEKQAFCKEHGIEYLVLKRLPKPGLPPRSSTHLRGF